MLDNLSRGSVAHRCTMCDIEQPGGQPKIGNRGSNPVAVNQFVNFFLYGVYMFAFSFSICEYSYFNVAYFDSILL